MQLTQQYGMDMGSVLGLMEQYGAHLEGSGHR